MVEIAIGGFDMSMEAIHGHCLIGQSRPKRSVPCMGGLWVIAFEYEMPKSYQQHVTCTKQEKRERERWAFEGVLFSPIKCTVWPLVASIAKICMNIASNIVHGLDYVLTHGHSLALCKTQDCFFLTSSNLITAL